MVRPQGLAPRTFTDTRRLCRPATWHPGRQLGQEHNPARRAPPRAVQPDTATSTEPGETLHDRASQLRGRGIETAAIRRSDGWTVYSPSRAERTDRSVPRATPQRKTSVLRPLRQLMFTSHAAAAPLEGQVRSGGGVVGRPAAVSRSHCGTSRPLRSRMAMEARAAAAATLGRSAGTGTGALGPREQGIDQVVVGRPVELEPPRGPGRDPVHAGSDLLHRDGPLVGEDVGKSQCGGGLADQQICLSMHCAPGSDRSEQHGCRKCEAEEFAFGGSRRHVPKDPRHDVPSVESAAVVVHRGAGAGPTRNVGTRSVGHLRECTPFQSREIRGNSRCSSGHPRCVDVVLAFASGGEWHVRIRSRVVAHLVGIAVDRSMVRRHGGDGTRARISDECAARGCAAAQIR